MTRKEIIKALRCFASEDNCPFDECNEKCPYWMEIDKYDIDNPNAEISDVHQLCRAASDMLEQDAHFAGVGKMVYCKNCAHLEYEDLGIYYCGLHRIAGQLSPEDYCSRGERKEKRHENH